MVDFTPPFGQDGERRLPNATEQQLGFSCDPAQLRELFNGLFWLLQGQVKDIADEAGVIPSQDGDITLLKRAVIALIASATGGGTADDYIMMTQARSRLPFYPEVLNVDGHLSVVSPSTGQVRVPAGLDFLHRGIYRVTTAQTDFPTDPSKTYHLRWNPTDGFVLHDLASGTYNSGSLAEVNPVFDSTYDDMLVARVITNSSNVPTITNLCNKVNLFAMGEDYAPGASGASFEDEKMPSEITQYKSVHINFARTPQVQLTAINDLIILQSGPTAGLERNIGARALSRYSVAVWGQGESDLRVGWNARA